MSWLVGTLRTYPEIAIFLSLAIGYWVGGKSFKGFSLGAVTATLLASIAIGQFGITVSADVKSIFFLMFLFAVGYGVGPQFVRGIAKDGGPQAIFAVVQCLLCLAAPIIVAKIAGYDLGVIAGLFAGSQTISASLGLATDAINHLNLSSEATNNLINAMPTSYAVSYIFGTIGSALILSMLGPRLLGINLVEACKDYEDKFGGTKELGGTGSVWHKFELRAYKIMEGSSLIGKTIAQAEADTAKDCRLFVLKVRKNGIIQDVNLNTILEVGDELAVAGRLENLVSILGSSNAEVHDPELLIIPVEGIDVYINKKTVNGKTLKELSESSAYRGIWIKKIKRGPTETSIPILPNTRIFQGDTVTLIGRTQDVTAVAKEVGVLDRPTSATDMAFVSLAIAIGALVGAVVIHVGSIPITLSTAGGTLIAGIVFGWLRAIHPTFGHIPESTVWFMNSVGLNMFIAVVGITAGPGFITGLQELGISIFFWGVFCSAMPLIVGMFIAKYVFRFHPAILLGVCAGARTTTAALGLICDAAKSQIPSLGYTVSYAVGNTLLTIWGMLLVMILS